MATILGLAPFEDATRENLIREKVDGFQKERNWAMKRGTRMEPTARGAYCRATKSTARPVCVEHIRVSWARVSLDGLCSPLAAANPTWVLELKCPNWETHSAALAGYVPDYYEAQVQWQLWVTGLTHCDFASYSDHSRYQGADKLAVVPVVANADRQAEILAEAEVFWAEVCERKREKQMVPGRAR